MKKGYPGSYDAETSEQTLTQKARPENPMNVSHYIGFDVHKKHINFCIKTADGAVVEQGPLGRATGDAARVGRETNPNLARGHGSNAVQRMDLTTP